MSEPLSIQKQPQIQPQSVDSDVPLEVSEESIKKAFLFTIAILALAMYCHACYIKHSITTSYSIYDETLTAETAKVSKHLSYVDVNDLYVPAAIQSFEKNDYDFDAASLAVLEGGSL